MSFLSPVPHSKETPFVAWQELARATYFNDIRGVAGALYIGNDKTNRDLDSQLTFETTLQIARPRRGFFRMLDKEGEIDFDELREESKQDYGPIQIGGELWRYGQASVDGAIVAEELSEIRRRLETVVVTSEGKELARRQIEFWKPALNWDCVSGIRNVSVAFRPESIELPQLSDVSVLSIEESWPDFGLRFESEESYLDDLRLMVSERIRDKTESQDDPLRIEQRQLPNGNVWQVDDRDRMAYLDEQIASIKASYAEKDEAIRAGHKNEEDEAHEKLLHDEIEKQLIYYDLLEVLIVEIKRLEVNGCWLFENNWFHPFQHEMSDVDHLKTRRRQHPQLMALESTIQNMRSTDWLSSNPVAVFAIWEKEIQMAVGLKERMAPARSKTDEWKSKLTPREKLSHEMTEAATRVVDNFNPGIAIAVEDRPAGLRIVGVLHQRGNESSEEDESRN